MAQPQMQEETKYAPKTVLSAVAVELALVSYTDGDGMMTTQFAIVGNNNVMLLDSKELGLGSERKPAGQAGGWLRDGILAAMGKK